MNFHKPGCRRRGPSRRRLRLEVLIVLGLSLGQSAVYSVVQLLDKMTRAPLAQGTSILNRSQSTREYFDLAYQLLEIFFALVPVILVFYFLTEQRRTNTGTGYGSVSAFRKLGFNLLPVREGTCFRGSGLPS